MARLPRFSIPGQPQHVIVRGNNRQETFCTDADYLFYLEKLRAACVKHGCEVHAYVLMTNHVHLLVTPQLDESLPLTMQMLGRYYVQYFNYCYRRTGTLFEGRYPTRLQSLRQ
jgi:putative transposase